MRLSQGSQEAKTQSLSPLALEVEGVHHAYGRKVALKNVGFSIRSGTFTALLGPNGAGKTTLFGILTRLLALQKGEVKIASVSIRKGAKTLRPLGLVFQQPTLDLDLTVRQNLRYFAALRGMSRREAEKRMTEELTRLDMVERIGERVRDLNGGHRRRVELARALLHDPALLLLDEPTVGLDIDSRAKILAHVHELSRERGLAVLWATHLIDEVWPKDELVVLAKGEVAAKGPCDEVIEQCGAEGLGEAFSALTGAARAAPQSDDSTGRSAA